MRITIFPNVKTLPDSHEKGDEASKAIVGKNIEVINPDELLQAITSYAWSPIVFKDCKRKADNFLESGCVALDIDGTTSISKAMEVLTKLNYLAILGTSTSHKLDGLDRFRILLPLNKVINNPTHYKSTISYIVNLFYCDTKCTDLARFFFGCKYTTIVNPNGRLLRVKKNGVEVISNTPVRVINKELSEETLDFINNGAVNGERHTRLFKAISNIKSSGINESKCIEMLIHLKDDLDDNIEYQVKHIYGGKYD